MTLEIKGVSFDYRSIPALRDVTLSVGDSEILTLLGPNGSGKSTLLKCINGILRPHRGVVMIDGRENTRIGRREIARMMSYFQQQGGRPLPLTVFEITLLGRKPYMSWTPDREDLKKVTDALKLLKIEHLATRYFTELSGGEAQKVRIATAIAQDPEIMLLDEPTSNLDLRHQLEIMQIVRTLTRHGVTAIVAMHDVNLASRFSDKIVMLKEGRVIGMGKPKEVITPKNMKLVYGVRAVIHHTFRYPLVTPVEPLES